MKILIDEENRIVAYAKVGDFENSIEVKDYEFEYPCDEYIFKNEEIKYSPKPFDKEKLKLKKREYLKKIRDNLLYAPLIMQIKPYGEENAIKVSFQVEEKDLAKFGRIKGVLFTLSKLGINKDNIEESKTILLAMGIDEVTINIIITFLKTGALPWVLADNTTKIFEFEKLEMVEVAFGIREQQIFSKFIELDKKLTAAKTTGEIESIKWG